MDGFSFWMGIFSLLLIQAFVLAILLLFDRTRANKFLGCFVIIYVHNCLRNSFPIDIYGDSTMVRSLVFSVTSTFYYPLLYLYVYEHIRPTTSRQILKHLLLPSLLFVLTMIFYSNKEVFTEDQYAFYRLTVNSILLGTSIFYGVLVVRITTIFPEWKNLIRAVRKRVVWFTYFILAYFVSTMFWIWIQHFMPLSNEMNDTITKIQLPLFYFILLLIPVYSYISLNRFKKFIQPRKILRSSPEHNEVEQRMKEAFQEKKLHLDPSFNTKKLAQLIEMPVEDLRIMIKNNHHCNVKDYINKMRIAEFKLLAKQESNQVYNIEGLAKMSGFKSKATFYRVFKSKEGITPHEFISNQ